MKKLILKMKSKENITAVTIIINMKNVKTLG